MHNEITNIGNRQWYALYVNSRAEKRVMESLIQKNIEAYVPFIKTMKQWSDRKKLIELPLFNGYVFVKTNGFENVKILQTKGVVNFVKHVGKIAEIREIEIKRLKQIVDLGYSIEAGVLSKKYNKGDKIKILSGPLKNIEGFVLNVNNEQFIEVILEKIGYCIKVKLPQGLLESINI